MKLNLDCPKCLDEGKEITMEDISQHIRDNLRVACPECKLEIEFERSGKNTITHQYEQSVGVHTE